MHQTEVSTMEEDEMKPLEADVAPQRRRTAVHRPSSIQASRATTFLSSISPRAVMADEEVPESAAQDDYEAAEEEEESRGPPPATSTRQVLTRNRGYGADGVSRGCRRQITFLSTVGNLMATRGRTEESVVATKARHHRSSSSSSSGRHDGESVATTPPTTMATDGMEYLASKPSSLTVQNIVTGDGQVARLRFVLAPQPSVACSSSSSRSVSAERANHRREATRNWKNATEELTCDGCREKADAYSAGMDSASPTSTTVDAVAELSGARPHALSPLPPGAAATPTSPTLSRSSSMRRTSPSARSQSSSVPRNVVKRTATSRRRPSTTLVRAAATPVSLCTILINYAPRGTLLWKEGQVVKPYRGESFSRESSRSNSSSSSTHSHSSGKSASGEDEGGSRPTGAGAERSRRGGGRTRTEMDMMDGADDEDENTYQDFVVNGAYLRGNYEDCHVSSSTSSESSDKEHHHRTASGGDDDGKSSSSHSRSSSNSSRSSGHSSRSSSSATTGGKGRGMHSERGMRSYGKLLNYTEHRRNAAFDNAFFLDSGNITGGERRRKCIVLPSYRTSVISFVDKKILKKDLNHNFYVQHPELEVRELKLTQLRKIKNELLVYALEDGSLLELSTVAHAYWYFERLVVQGMVGKHNRKVILAACILLAVKFLETGDVLKKLAYFRARWRRFHFVGGMLGGGREEGEEDDEDSVDWSKVEQNEFKVYVGLHFTLLPDVGSTVINTHIERLLQQINVTSSEYYSKNFVAPVYLNNYNYYSNLYY